MKLLIIGHNFPEPTTTAAGGRMLQLIDLFLERDFHITFASTAIKSEKSVNLRTRSIEEISVKLNDASFDQFLKELQPTIVMFDRFITEEQFGWRVAEVCPDALRILDTEDLHFLRRAREVAYKKKLPVKEAVLFTETAKREVASILRCDLSLLISEVELNLLVETFKVPEGLVWYLPFLLNSEISEEKKIQQAKFEERHHFLAVGNMKHAPNVASIKILKQHIWPSLSEKFPQAELHVYGAYVPQQLQELHSPKERFLIKGWVEDISAVMQTAKVQLAPIPFGAGLKGKILDALQNGLPTVTTPIGAEGMFGKSETHNCIAQDWQEFVDLATLLYEEKSAWLGTQQQGYFILRDRFQKKSFAAAFTKKIIWLSENLKEHREQHFIGQILQYKTLQATKYLSKWIEQRGLDPKRIKSNPLFSIKSYKFAPVLKLRMEAQKKVAYYTLGCKLNFSETATIARDFKGEGFARVDFSEKADIYVINTCSVTENADKRFKSIVKKAQRINPDALVAAVGCYAQLKPEALADVNGVDLVLGATEKFKITSYIHEMLSNPDRTALNGAEVHSCEIEDADFYVGSYSVGDRTRAFLKVQDGCDYKCTYCTIPLARGISRSDTLENVLKNAAEISAQNIKEIVLTGVNIGDYGKGEFGNKKHKHTFLELCKALDTVDGVERLRISSIEPNLLKNETIDFVSKSRTFVPHFHIPLQSGSNAILKLMRRRYMRELYVDRVAKIKEVLPHACIGVDVIVGFPGETEERFLETYYFLNELDVSYLHVFTYSERDHTPAATMEGVVSKRVRAKRSKMLRGLSAKKRRAFYESQLGSERTILFEGENKAGYIHGFTENYVKVKAPWNPELVNTVHAVTLTEIDEDGLVRFEYKNEAVLLG